MAFALAYNQKYGRFFLNVNEVETLLKKSTFEARSKKLFDQSAGRILSIQSGQSPGSKPKGGFEHRWVSIYSCYFNFLFPAYNHANCSQTSGKKSITINI